MAITPPVLLFVCGAWHPPHCYDPLKTRLEAMGYEFLCPTLPSLGPDAKGITYEADVECIRRVATDLFDDGREVVLIAHSAGGIPACVAIEGLDVTHRAKEGKTGGFSKIIFISAFAIPVRGWDLLTTFGGTWPDWQITAKPYTKGHLITLQDRAKYHFYNDLPDAEAQRLFDSLQPHSQDAFEIPVDYIPADIEIPKTYIICERDHALPPAAQRKLAEQTPGMKVETIDTGHSPFASQPDECANLIKKIVQAAPGLP